MSECYSVPAPAVPMNNTRDTNIVGVSPTTQEKLHISVSQSSGCVKMAFQKRLWVLSFWGVKLQNGRQGEGVTQCKISNMQNIVRLTSYLQWNLNSVSQGPDLTLTQVVWYIFELNSTLIHSCCIKKLVELSLPFVVPLTTGVELDSFNSTKSPQH